MISAAADTYREIDPAKKNVEWATKVIGIHRMNWRRLTGVARGIKNRELLYSMQSMEKIRESFQDEEFKKNIDFLPLPIMEAFINAVVEEITQRPPKME